MRAARLAIAALVALLLAACSQPLPQDKLAYAGSWRGPGMALDISTGGEVRYRRVKGNANTSIDAPIKAFHGDDFEVGIGPLTTRFAVSKPPTLEDGRWTMTVDGVTLTRPATGA